MIPRPAAWLPILVLLLLGGAAASGQAKQPPAYVLSAGDKVIIILGSVPSTLSGFTVSRRGPGEGSFTSLTDTPVRPVDDPFVARQLMGGDFDWIARRVETVDPEGPFGAKESGQGPLLPIIPSVTNAVYDAVGVWVDEVPCLPEKVLRALDAKAKGEPGRYGPTALPPAEFPEPIRVEPPEKAPRLAAAAK